MEWTNAKNPPALTRSVNKNTNNCFYEIIKSSEYVLGKFKDDYYRVRYVVKHFPAKTKNSTKFYWVSDKMRIVEIEEWRSFS